MKKGYDPTKLLNKARAKVQPTKKLPDFKPGDTVKVHVKVTEGDKSRTQVYEGLVISKSRGELGGRFVVRKISYGIGVERIFPMVSPVIEKLQIVSKGDIRRSKLYFLRDLKGRSARIKSDLVFGAEAEATGGSESDDADPTLQAKAVQA